MSLHDTKTEYDLTSVPALDEEFSLEEILAEYGSSREKNVLQEAEQLSDRVAIMKDGKLLICDSPENIKKVAGEDSFERAFISIVKGG